jgi:ATP-dependent Clp protease ATP-binding subunit ClpE
MLAEQNITLAVTDEVKEKIVELGYHPAFGARPLRRAIQDQLEDKITDLILEQGACGKLVAVLENNEIVIKANEK